MTLKVFFMMIIPLLAIYNAPGQDDTGSMVRGWNCYREVTPDHIRTVLLHREGWELSDPVIRLETDDRLRLSFDDLQSGVRDYRYTVIHCNADWSPSPLRQDEYISGYREGEITDYSFSLNTLVPYTHYSLTYPGDGMDITESGNYLLVVFLEDPAEPLFIRRFFAVIPEVGFQVSVRVSSIVSQRMTHQEVDAEIDASALQVGNAFRSFRLVIMQNGRWDNALTGLQPKMIVNGRLTYDLEGVNVFEAGNEFRPVDLKTLRYNTERIVLIEKTPDSLTAGVKPDERRVFQQYHTEEDINGRYMVKTEDGRDSDIGAEYLWARFTLPFPAPVPGGELVWAGRASHWGSTPESRMAYDYTRHEYFCTLLLKQGWYDYQYLWVPEGACTGQLILVEGSHSETGNEYMLLLYYRAPGTLHDCLAGIHHAASLPE